LWSLAATKALTGRVGVCVLSATNPFGGGITCFPNVLRERDCVPGASVFFLLCHHRFDHRAKFGSRTGEWSAGEPAPPTTHTNGTEPNRSRHFLGRQGAGGFQQRMESWMDFCCCSRTAGGTVMDAKVGRRCLALAADRCRGSFSPTRWRSRSQICQIGARGAADDVVHGVIAPGRRLARFGAQLRHTSPFTTAACQRAWSTSHSAPTPAGRT